MIDKERAIAEWAFARVHDSATADSETRILDGDLFTGSNGELWIATPGHRSEPWSPSNDITIWHSTLFQKIEEEGLWDLFAYEVSKNPPPTAGVLWAVSIGIKATPAQLTDALYEVIKERE